MGRRHAFASAIAVLVLAIVSCFARRAQAAEGAGDDSLRLTWRAPAGCPSEADVRGATLRTVEADARGAKAAPVLEASADVTAAKAGAPWRVVLRTKRGAATGERAIEASSCQGVADATAVLLALALVPGTHGFDDPAAAPAAEPPAADKAEPAARGRHSFAVGAAFASDFSTLPHLAPGGSVTLAWTPGIVRVEADGRRWGSQSRSIEGGSGARFTLTSIGLRGCASLLRRGPVDLAPCLGGDLHLLDARGFGADANYTPTARFTTASGGVLGRFSLTHWLAVRGRIEAMVPLARPSFVVENEGYVHRPPTLGASASVGAEVNFL